LGLPFCYLVFVFLSRVFSFPPPSRSIFCFVPSKNTHIPSPFFNVCLSFSTHIHLFGVVLFFHLLYLYLPSLIGSNVFSLSISVSLCLYLAWSVSPFLCIFFSRCKVTLTHTHVLFFLFLHAVPLILPPPCFLCPPQQVWLTKQLAYLYTSPYVSTTYSNDISSRFPSDQIPRIDIDSKALESSINSF